MTYSAASVSGRQRVAAAVALLAAALTVVLAVGGGDHRLPAGPRGARLRRGRAGGGVVRGGAGRAATHRGDRRRGAGPRRRRGAADPQRWLGLPGVARARHRDLARGGPRRVPGARPPSGRRPAAATGAVRQPVVRRRESRQGRARRRGLRPRDQDGRAAPRRRSRATRPRRRRRGCRRARGGRWGRHPGHRRDSGRRTRPSLRLHSRRAPATTSHSTWAWTATTSSGPSTPSSTAANTSSTSARSTAGCSSTTSRWACTPRRCRARATATRRSARCSTPHRRSWVRPGSELDLRWTLPRWCRPTRRRPRSWCPTTPTGSAAPSAPGPAHGSTPGSSVSPSCLPAPRTARQEPHSSALLRQWSTPTFQVDSAQPVPLGIDGEAVVLDPPIRFRIRPRVLRVRIAPRHPGASPSAMQPDHAGESLRVLAAIAAGRAPTTDIVQPPEAR